PHPIDARLLLLETPRIVRHLLSLSFFSTDPVPTEIYTLSLHDALPILSCARWRNTWKRRAQRRCQCARLINTFKNGAIIWTTLEDRKSTRLNSSHQIISYAVFCLKKKKKRRKNN